MCQEKKEAAQKEGSKLHSFLSAIVAPLGNYNNNELTSKVTLVLTYSSSPLLPSFPSLIMFQHKTNPHILVSTVFLASGYMFPRLRSAFWFPFTFILVRIIGHALILQELLFNYPTPWGAAELFVGVLVLHIYWIYKYFVGVRRRTRQARKAALEQGGRGEKGGAKEASAVVSRTGLFKGAFTSSSASTSALTTGSAGKTIQLRIQKSKK